MTSSDAEEIVTCLQRYNPEIKSAGFEACALTRYPASCLQAAGYEPTGMEARLVGTALSAMRIVPACQRTPADWPQSSRSSGQIHFQTSSILLSSKAVFRSGLENIFK